MTLGSSTSVGRRFWYWGCKTKNKITRNSILFISLLCDVNCGFFFMKVAVFSTVFFILIALRDELRKTFGRDCYDELSLFFNESSQIKINVSAVICSFYFYVHFILVKEITYETDVETF